MTMVMARRTTYGATGNEVDDDGNGAMGYDDDDDDDDDNNTSSMTSDEGNIAEGDNHNHDNGKDACALMVMTSAHQRCRPQNSQL